jgi:hypothetical protein
MSRLTALILLLILPACSNFPVQADQTSDIPEFHVSRIDTGKDADSYDRALQIWRTPEDVSAWIGARFTYDVKRSMKLSETQRSGSESLQIYQPDEFFVSPYGVCVDLSRFAVETLRRIVPDSNPGYLMIEFSPVKMAGNTLRLHWIAFFRREGKYYFFADSKRPGHIAGPYTSTEEFISDYTVYRGRQILSFRELESYQRKERVKAAKQSRNKSP